MLSILHQASKKNYKPLHNSTTIKSPSTTSPIQSCDPTLSCHLVGSLQYLTIKGLDVSFVVNHLCPYMHWPTSLHFQQLKQLLRYLKVNISFDQLIYRSSLQLQAFSDFYWAANTSDQKSTTSCLLLGTTLTLWIVRK